MTVEQFTSTRRVCVQVDCNFLEQTWGTRRGTFTRASYSEQSLLRLPVRRLGVYRRGSKPYGQRRKYNKCPGKRYYRLEACQ